MLRSGRKGGTAKRALMVANAENSGRPRRRSTKRSWALGVTGASGPASTATTSPSRSATRLGASPAPVAAPGISSTPVSPRAARLCSTRAITSAGGVTRGWLPAPALLAPPAVPAALAERRSPSLSPASAGLLPRCVPSRLTAAKSTISGHRRTVIWCRATIKSGRRFPCNKASIPALRGPRHDPSAQPVAPAAPSSRTRLAAAAEARSRTPMRQPGGRRAML